MPQCKIADNSSCDCREMLNSWDDPGIEERDCTSLLSILGPKDILPSWKDPGMEERDCTPWQNILAYQDTLPHWDDLGMYTHTRLAELA